MNDLAVPFFAVFLIPYIGTDLETCDVSTVATEVLTEIEADSYWCFTTLVDAIQDYFTPDRSGLQKQVQVSIALLLISAPPSLLATPKWTIYLGCGNGIMPVLFVSCVVVTRAF
jgi:hypothetical protein